MADLFAATSRTHRGQYWSLQCEDVGGTQPVNRHRGGDLRRPQFFPSQNPSLVSSTFPATCLFASVMSISVTACTQASSSLKDSTWLSLIFLVASTAQSYPSLLRTIGFCTATFELAAVSLTVPLTESVVAVTQSAATTCSSDDCRRQLFRSHLAQVRFNGPCYLQVCGPWLPVWFSM